MQKLRHLFPLIILFAFGCNSNDNVVDIVPPQQTTLLTITGQLAPFEPVAISTIFYSPLGEPNDLVLEFRPLDEKSWEVVVVYFGRMETDREYQSANRVYVEIDRAGRVQPSSAVILLPFKTSMRDEPLEMEMNIRVVERNPTIKVSWQNGYQWNRGYAPWVSPD